METVILQTVSGKAPKKDYLRGYSLPELICSLTIILILGVSAIPASSNLIGSSRQRVQANALLDAVKIARETAFRTQAEITLCPYSATNHCGHDWNKGWILIQYLDTKKTVNKKILVQAFGNDSITILSNREKFSFRHGRRITNGRISFCRAGSLSKTVVISYTGKTRVETVQGKKICG